MTDTIESKCDVLEQTARREGQHARRDLWLTLLLLSSWTIVVALVAAELGGGR